MSSALIVAKIVLVEVLWDNRNKIIQRWQSFIVHAFLNKWTTIIFSLITDDEWNKTQFTSWSRSLIQARISVLSDEWVSGKSGFSRKAISANAHSNLRRKMNSDWMWIYLEWNEPTNSCENPLSSIHSTKWSKSATTVDWFIWYKILNRGCFPSFSTAEPFTLPKQNACHSFLLFVFGFKI